MAQALEQTRLQPRGSFNRRETLRAVWRGILRSAELVTSAIPFIAVLATIIAQILYAGYNPWQEPVSSLVWSPYGALQTAAFYLLGFSVIILAGKLFPKAKTRILRIGIIVLALTGVGMVLIGIFPAGQAGDPDTIINDIHLSVTSILICLFPAGCFIMAPKLKECFAHKWVSRYTWAAGALGVALIILLTGMHFNNLGWLGTLERLVILNGLVWVQVITILTLKKKWHKTS
jgi:hypothetical membrane protein